ncbi:hypothetical protein [Yoonia sp.]|jgi:hypothetical protein|uniref:hypothetical protein n=1 Tax=Yoonia sp. TaxID=2212373 RepID=UPI0025DA20E5|nr:hypothetical protein [Yoonia sp.]
MFNADENGVYARVQASSARRFFAYGVLFSLGALLIYAPLAKPPALPWLVFMLGFGGLVLWLAEQLRRGTRVSIELTETEVRDSTGRVLARLDDVRSVERGALAMKPSNGFTLVLKSKKPRAWAPGLWWRLGNRVGVGGVTSAGEAKFMAEQIAFRIATRDD